MQLSVEDDRTGMQSAAAISEGRRRTGGGWRLTVRLVRAGDTTSGIEGERVGNAVGRLYSFKFGDRIARNQVRLATPTEPRKISENSPPTGRRLRRWMSILAAAWLMGWRILRLCRSKSFRQDTLKCIWKILSRPIMKSALCTITFFSISNMALADEGKIVNSLEKSAWLIEDVKTSCSQDGPLHLKGLYQITNLSIIVERDLGAVSALGTGHAHGPLYSGDALVGLLLSYYSERQKCVTYALFDKSVRNRRLKIKSLHKSIESLAGASQAEATAILELERKCVTLGERARHAFTGGDFTMGPSGDRLGIEGTFNCDSAIARNISAILVTVSGNKLRISIVDDTVFISEAN